MPTNESTNDLPLTEATYLIMLSLAPGPKRGYGILKDVESLSHGRIIFSTGTLYGAIKRLLELGWIARAGSDLPDEGGRPRKEYHLTPAGKRILGAEISRMDELLQAVREYFPGASQWTQNAQ